MALRIFAITGIVVVCSGALARGQALPEPPPEQPTPATGSPPAYASSPSPSQNDTPMMVPQANLSISYLYGPAEIITGAKIYTYEAVWNDAPVGGSAMNYSIYGTNPFGVQGPSSTGTRVADGGASYDYWQVAFSSIGMPLGANTLTVSVSAPGALHPQQSASGAVNVVNHATPGFNINGTVYRLGKSPINLNPTEEPALPNEQNTAVTAGNTIGLSAPNMVGNGPGNFVSGSSAPSSGVTNQGFDGAEPADETAELDIDSITSTGSNAISITLAPEDDIVPDDEGSIPPFDIDVNTANTGTFFTDFELNYSDEQDLLGADAPGSEHGYFGVEAQVTDIGNGQDEVTVDVIVPEPTSVGLLVAGATGLLARRRRPGW